jgi:hypothetical protein
MSIYLFDNKIIVDQLTPPLLRKPIRLAWLYTLTYPIQRKFNDTFANTKSFKKGYLTVAKWNSGVTYTTGDKVRYGIKIYEALEGSTGVVPFENEDTWLLICNDFVGADSRVKFNNQKMLFEYVLNLYLNTTATTLPTIYITRNTIDINGFYLGVDGVTDLGELGTNTNQKQFLGTSYSLNQYAFTINVPLALYTSLGSTATNRENMVKEIADRYNSAGALYNIVTY